jgi:hypothetical protein
MEEFCISLLGAIAKTSKVFKKILIKLSPDD